MKTTLCCLAGLAGLAQAHMQMTYPIPFRSKFGSFSKQDHDMINPLDATGSNFPCKGYLSDLGTPDGKPTADWQAGQTYDMMISGGAIHDGGSFQMSLSFDQGKTWKVIKSYIGGVPAAQGDSTYAFTIPKDTPSGDAVFAWTWFNFSGNHEMYMNCAAVTIAGGSGKGVGALSDRPDMFVANIGNGCGTWERADLEFPDPGDDVVLNSTNTNNPTKDRDGVILCPLGGGNDGGNDGGDGGGDDGGDGGDDGYQPPSANPPAPAPTAPETPSQPADTSIPGGVFITSPPGDTPTAAPVAPAPAPAPEPSNGGGGDSSLVTVTRTAPGTGEDPIPTPEVPVPVPGDDGGDDGTGGDAHEPGSVCTKEGEWNCLGGFKFQRCASGRWSVVMSMSAGTKCASGKSQALVISGMRSHFRRALRDLADNN